MKSINPDDFRVMNNIELVKIPTELNIDADIQEPELDPKIKANIDLYKEQLKG